MRCFHILGVTFVSLLLINLSGCTSSLSDTPVNDPALLAVAINVKNYETNDGYALAEIEAVLTDSQGKVANTPSLKIKVNGIEMPLQVGQDLYYGKHPVYTLTDEGEDGISIEANTLYTFTLVLSDSTEQLIGSLKIPGKLQPEQFNFPDSLSANQDFILEWNVLPVPTEIVVYRMTETTDSTGTLVLGGGPYDPEALQKNIPKGKSPAGGKCHIPASYTRIPNGRVTDLGFKIQAVVEGEVKGKFLSGSYIRYTSGLERYVPLAD